MKSETRQDIIYFPLKALLAGVARFPFSVLYRISDFLYFITFYVVRYRMKIVKKNVSESFPELSDADHQKIVKKFYRHFTDYFVETIKLQHISDDEMRRRVKFEDVELIDECLDRGRSSIIYAGHYGNWEYLTSITLWSRHDPNECVFAQIYRELRNKWFDRFFLELRGRFNSKCIEKKNSLRTLLKIKLQNKCSVTGFISDQHPSGNDTNHVIRFMNHDTAMITGSEILARRLDQDVFFFDISKLKRGYYKVVIKKIAHNPNEQDMMAITDAYATILESCIKRQPELWLWTHNRWKHKCEHASQQLTPLK